MNEREHALNMFFVYVYYVFFVVYSVFFVVYSGNVKLTEWGGMEWGEMEWGGTNVRKKKSSVVSSSTSSIPSRR